MSEPKPTTDRDSKFVPSIWQTEEDVLEDIERLSEQARTDSDVEMPPTLADFYIKEKKAKKILDDLDELENDSWKINVEKTNAEGEEKKEAPSKLKVLQEQIRMMKKRGSLRTAASLGIITKSEK